MASTSLGSVMVAPRSMTLLPEPSNTSGGEGTVVGGDVGGGVVGGSVVVVTLVVVGSVVGGDVVSTAGRS